MVYSYKEAVRYILEIPKFTKKNPMENTRHFMQCLGNPQDKIKTVHVAGTNGKGSVCAMIAGALLENEKSVGLFTSPHLVRINERIRINGEEISDSEFAEIFGQVLSVVQKCGKEGFEHPTFFEFLYGMAMTAFYRHGTEYVVAESGMGGRSDTVNVVKQPAVSVITSIGRDHMEYLGDTIEKIAFEKAGIIKQDTPLVYLDKQESVTKIIEQEAGQKTDKVIKVAENTFRILKKGQNYIDFSIKNGYYGCNVFRIPFVAEYQVENAALALAALSCLGDFPIGKLQKAFRHTVWEGRMEQAVEGVILDGAHNEPGIREFVRTVNQYECRGQKHLLFSAVSDKEYKEMIAYIAENADFSKIYVTEIQGKRCLKAEWIRREFEKHTKVPVAVFRDNEEAWNAAYGGRKKGDILFCAGSLYLIGSLKEIIRRKDND